MDGQGILNGTIGKLSDIPFHPLTDDKLLVLRRDGLITSHQALLVNRGHLTTEIVILGL